MSSKASSGAGKTGSFGSGDRVEVLSSEEGFSDAWATAVCVSQSKGDWQVEYSKFVDADGKQLREKARAYPACLPTASDDVNPTAAQREAKHEG